MTFSNPIVGGVTLIRPAVQSPNYVEGSEGWSINKDGSAEFNDVTVRGSLHAGDDEDYIDISPSPNPLITISTSDSEQIAPANIGYGILGGGTFFINGPDFGMGKDSIMFEADSTNQTMYLEFNDNLDISRVDQSTRILMDSTGMFIIGVQGIQVTGHTTFLHGITSSNMDQGSVTATFTAASQVDVPVVFSKTFSTVPRVNATLRGNPTLPGGSSALIVRTFNVTTTGCTVRVNDVGGVARTLSIDVDWFAKSS